MVTINSSALDEINRHVPSGAIIALGNGEGTIEILASLAKVKGKIDAIISSTAWNHSNIKQCGFIALDTNDVDCIDLYIDTAPMATKYCSVNKGVDKELLRSKFLAQYAEKFICCTDKQGLSEAMTTHPVSVEVLPYARSYVSRILSSRFYNVTWSPESITENGNHLLKLKNIDILEPGNFEKMIENIPGVLGCSIISRFGPDTLIVSDGEEILTFNNPVTSKVKDFVSDSLNKMKESVTAAWKSN